MSRLVDLSHPIRAGMVTYPGLPGPEITTYLAFDDSHAHYAPGTEFAIGRISLVGNTGTYVDSPAHRHRDGADLAGLPLERLADLPGIVVVAGERRIGTDAFDGVDVSGRAVLIHTGWDRHWDTDRYGTGHPYLTEEAAIWLVAHHPALVGIDSLNIDDNPDGGARPVHTRLLAAGIPIVEHLCGLERLPRDGFRFHAAPPAIAGMASFPVRAYAVLDR